MQEERGLRYDGAGLGGPASVAWRLNGETVVVLGWGRAVLLQLAHPLVAAGVAEHSTFNASARGHWTRLRATLDAMLALTFGTQAEVRAAADAINAIHDRVHGVLPETAGVFPAGTPYSAHDPELLRWVYATLVESSFVAYSQYVGPLTRAERDRYCAEVARLGPLLGTPAGWLPDSAAAVEAYMAAMRASGQLAVTPTARRLAEALLLDAIPSVAWPLRRLSWLTTVGLLPPDMRAAYGYRWGWRERRLFELWTACVRRPRPLAPALLRRWPQARAAQRRAAAALSAAR